MPKDAKKQKKQLVLLDAHAIIHRAYHALPDFSSSGGEPTGALYGLSSMLLKIVQDLKPDYLIACYDLPEPTYRHEVYKDYKAGRAKVDDELVVQLERSRDIFKAFGIPIYDQVSFEADDILGTIVEKTKGDKNIEVVIASGDMDTMQLISGKRVRVYTLKKGIKDTIVYDEKAVEERFGFKPKLLPDYKGLRGDPSDNIIGIKGIGEKTATILIKEFGSIEHIYSALKKDEKQFIKAGITQRIIGLLKDNEEEALFSKELATIQLNVPIDFKYPEKSWRDTLDINTVLELFSELNFRTLSQRVKNLFGAKDKKNNEKSFYNEAIVGEEVEGEKEQVSEKELSETAIGLWLVDSDITNPTMEDILDFAQTTSFAKAKEMVLGEIKNQKLEKVYTEIELPLISVISKMQERGIVVDLSHLDKLSKEYHIGLEILEKKIYKHAGEEFNINSPKQLGVILFDKMEFSVKNQKKTGTGQKSTRESELEKMKELHPIISDILSYRELKKLLSTYIDNIPDMVGNDGRLHARFLQSGTTTGRMSSQNPNLQNIPIRTERGKNIRSAFVASDGYELVALDYSQIELRVAAFLSGDEKLIDIFKSGGDIHAAVASEMFGVSPECVDMEMRRRAKVINFGILYGMGVNALRQSLGTTREEAQQFYNDYFKNFSGVAHYLEQVKADATRLGYTQTHFGRRRHFEGLRSKLPFIRAQAERMAINAPIQGTQADIIKIAMALIDEYIVQHKLENDVHLLLQVHDELVYEIRKDKVKETATEIKKIMESILSTEETKGVPIEVVVHSGKNWGVLRHLEV